MSKRFIAFVLTFVLLVASIDCRVFAAENAEDFTLGEQNQIPENGMEKYSLNTVPDSSTSSEEDITGSNTASEQQEAEIDKSVETEEGVVATEIADVNQESAIDEQLTEGSQDSDGKNIAITNDSYDEIMPVSSSLGEYVYFGHVTNYEYINYSSVANELEGKAAGFYISDGRYYRVDSVGDVYCCTPLRWKIIKDEGDCLLLIQDFVLEGHEWDSRIDGTTLTWEDSQLRTYLNSSDFLNKYFTEEEQNDIQISEVSNTAVNDNSTAIASTHDKVFLPSVSEVLAMYSSDEARKAHFFTFSKPNISTSALALSEESAYNYNDYTCAYWTRTPCHLNYGFLQPAFVTAEGECVYNNNVYNTWGVGLRPLLRISKSSTHYSYASLDVNLSLESENDSFTIYPQKNYSLPAYSIDGEGNPSIFDPLVLVHVDKNVITGAGTNYTTEDPMIYRATTGEYDITYVIYGTESKPKVGASLQVNVKPVIETISVEENREQSSLEIYWYNETPSPGYEICRSDAIDGTYETIFWGGYYDLDNDWWHFYYEDTDIEAGKEYWYKVRGLFSNETRVFKSVLNGIEAEFCEPVSGISENGKAPGDSPDVPTSDIPTARVVDCKGIMQKGMLIFGEFDVYLDETAFSKSSKVYNHDLAKFGIQMETLCGSDNMKNVLDKQLGFNNSTHVKYKGDDYEGEYSSYWIGHKTILLDEKQTNILYVIIQGTIDAEWINNFAPDRGEKHQGFKSAADNVYDGISTYISDNKLSDKNLKLYITGHSRGAAAANLLGARIDDKGIKGIASSDDVWVYTFATPNTTRIGRSVREGEKYKNIYNIVNPEDFVTKVLPARWGYGRYGTTFVLPSKTTEKKSKANYVDYKEYKNEVKTRVGNISGNTDYSPYPLGMFEVNTYVNTVTAMVWNINAFYDLDISGNPLHYVTNNRHTLQKLYTCTLAYLLSNNKSKQRQAILNFLDASTGFYGALGMQTVIFFLTAEGVGRLSDALADLLNYDKVLSKYFGEGHQPETYLAAMETLNEEQLKQKRNGYLGIANCPVDVTVYDSDGHIAGQIINNIVNESYTDIQMVARGDSKQFYLPAEGDYRVELSGNGDGVLDYSVSLYDADTGEEERIFYNDLSVSKEGENDHSYTQNITANMDVASLVLLNANSEVQERTAFITQEQLGRLSVDVTVEGKGSASGYSNLTPGDYVTLEAFETDESVFDGWYTTGGELITTEKTYSYSISENGAFTAKFKDIPNGLWITFDESDQCYYTGSVIKPAVLVYDGKKLLKENTDYKVSYKNNINAYELAEGDSGFILKKAPAVVITGKGNYSGTETQTFKIFKKNISDDDVTKIFTDAYVVNKGGKNPLLAFSAKLHKKVLQKKDYELTVKDKAGKEVTSYNAEGDYILTVKGAGGNYSGECNLPFTVTSKTPVSALKISKIAPVEYDGSEKKPDLVVKLGNKTLVKDTDFRISYQNNVNIGTASATITGMGDYCGNRTVAFSITGRQLKNAKFEKFKTSIPYTGKTVLQDEAKLSFNGESLKEGTDYDVTYSKNKKVGKATATYKGKGKYSGSVKKTYKITAYDIAADADKRLRFDETPISAPYVKGGAKPSVVLYDGENQLLEGTDYTLSYKNNTSVSLSTDSNAPAIVVKGKGNYAGIFNQQKTFTITAKDLSQVTVSASDVAASTKKGTYKSIPSLIDTDGKKLKAGTDYSSTYVYTYKNNTTVKNNGTDITRSADEIVDANDIVPVNTILRVTVNAKEGSKYGGDPVTAEYRIVKGSIVKAKVTVKNPAKKNKNLFDYTGKQVTLTQDNLVVKVGKTTLAADQYEILEDTYKNNINKGTASVQIRGLGDYGGTATVKYKIGTKGFRWFWRILGLG